MFRRSSVYRGIAIGIGLAVVPASAFAVAVSSNYGEGTQFRTGSYSNGANVSGDLRAYSGYTVYYAGNVEYDNCADSYVGRYTTNTSATGYVTRGGTIRKDAVGVLCSSVKGVDSRICKVLNNLPDPCGPHSTRY